jgi:hypothetical protein
LTEVLDKFSRVESTIDSDVVGAVRQWTILTGRQACKRSKLAIQMRLIVESAVESYTRPVHSIPGIDLVDYSLKAPDTAKYFGRESHGIAKESDKPLRAITCFIADLADARQSRLRRDLPKGVSDCGIHQ